METILTSWIVIASQAYELAQQRKKIELEERNLLQQLKILSDNKTRSEGDFVFIKETRVGSVDYSRIAVLSALDLTPYRKADVEVWKLISIGAQ